MHKNVLAILAFILIGLSVNAQKTTVACEELIAKSKKEAANIKMYTETWDKIFNKGEIDQINPTNFDTNVIWRRQKDEQVGGTGIEAFKKHFNYYLITFSDIKFTFIDVFASGDKLVKHWNFKGIHRETGRTMDLSGVTLVIMRDGKIVEEQDFDDNYWYKQQLGQIPMK